MQIRIRSHILAALIKQGTADAAQGPSQHETSFEGILPHPDTILGDNKQEPHYDPVGLFSHTAGDTSDQERKRHLPEAVMIGSEDGSDESPTAKKRAADNEFDPVADAPKHGLVE
ncbi:hypothetical protein FCOIX_9596 [Fusarium coicis]|nr:hypothetical protein FCOIX_9596 [Fusarium coicis]